MSLNELVSQPLHLRRFFNRVQELPFALRVAAWRGAEIVFDEHGVPLRPSNPLGKNGLIDRMRRVARILDGVEHKGVPSSHCMQK